MMKEFIVASILLLFRSLTLAGAADEMPPLPYDDRGACPFECCTYREWVANEQISVFEKRNEVHVVFRLQPGEHVRAMTGVVVTHKVGVTKILAPVHIGYLPGSRGPVLMLTPNDTIYTLHYAGEGTQAFWYRGKVYVDEISNTPSLREDTRKIKVFEIRSQPEYIWWAEIRNGAGQIGWTSDTDKFSNQDACG